MLYNQLSVYGLCMGGRWNRVIPLLHMGHTIKHYINSAVLAVFDLSNHCLRTTASLVTVKFGLGVAFDPQNVKNPNSSPHHQEPTEPGVGGK